MLAADCGAYTFLKADHGSDLMCYEKAGNRISLFRFDFSPEKIQMRWSRSHDTAIIFGSDKPENLWRLEGKKVSLLPEHPGGNVINAGFLLNGHPVSTDE